MARNGWSREHALARIAAQMPLSEKRKRADYVIENSGDLAALEVNTRRVLDTLIAAIHVQTARQKGSVQ
jgi:dephospho-CoA kinase